MKTVEDHLFRKDRFFMQLWTLSEIQLHFIIKKNSCDIRNLDVAL